eukprot:1905722-Heterocapsa_arctica.AAC.1
MDAKRSGLYSAMLVETIGKAIVNDRNSVPDNAMEIGAIGEGAPEEREGAVRVEGGVEGARGEASEVLGERPTA